MGTRLSTSPKADCHDQPRPTGSSSFAMRAIDPKRNLGTTVCCLKADVAKLNRPPPPTLTGYKARTWGSG